MLVATLVVAVVLAAAARTVIARRTERAADCTFARGSDGIIIGAESFTIAPTRGELAGAPAVLLIHGFGDTPQTMRLLGEHLAAHGWRVRAPLLRGHGRTVRDLAAARADQWIGDMRAELAALRASGRTVAICGLSMGGAIATILAAESPAPSALVLIAPYVEVAPLVRRLARVHVVWSLFTRYVRSRGERSIEDPVERVHALGYGLVTPRLVAELARVVRLARARAPRVTAPTLVIQSRHDNRTTVAAAGAAFDRIGAREKELAWTDRGAHVITVDHGRERVFALATDWLTSHDP